MQTLQRGGVEGFTLEAVARRAGVVKGLILYHYASRGRLLRAAAAQIATSRSAAIERALASARGAEAFDACWAELRRQAEDGTARAWLSLCTAGLIDRSARNAHFEDAARDAAMAVNRALKGDRLMPPGPSGTDRQGLQAPRANPKLPDGCEAAVSSMTRSSLAQTPGRCIS